MLPTNPTAIFLTGAPTKDALIKIALHWAELGETAWIISRQRITQLPPELVQTVDKEALKLLIFIYVAELKEVAVKLNEIHLWNKLPRVIIVADIDQYWKGLEESDWMSSAAYYSALLLDATAVYSRKHNKNSYLIVSAAKASSERATLIKEFYFSNLVNGAQSESNGFKEVVKIFTDNENT